MLCRIPVVRFRSIAKRPPTCYIQRSAITGKYPLPRMTLSCPNYALYPSETHCFIGLNGSGKTQLITRMVGDSLPKSTKKTHSETDPLRAGMHNLKEQLSFVRRYREDFVSNVLGGVSSSDAKDLIVRFGLYGLWSSKVKHLSTGEIRKLMLARLLIDNPHPNVIFLDQPFDGLDENGKKQVEWMMTQLTRGFSRLLIDTGGKNKAFAYKIQIVVIVSCLQYIPIDITTHAILVGKQQTDEKHPNLRVFPNDRTPSGKKALLESVESFLWEENLAQGHVSRRSEGDILRALGFLYKEKGVLPDEPILTLENLSFAHRNKDFLLENVSFQRLPREHWVLLGPNGSGKSSLTRLMLSDSLRETIHNGKVCVNLPTGEENKIRVISTDTHVNLLEEAFYTKSTKSSRDLILSDAVSQEHGMVAANLLGISQEILSRPFLTLSHGEQKLVLIAQALASAPRVLILDENESNRSEGDCRSSDNDHTSNR
uniref:ATPbinding Cassette (ABC) Superfamily putative n=1 Tax=Albugo laibachii Nc14 TaxID=890382 RepID=F0WKX2_9STRA|nr:ATPbinding Cassette (ABC) Superfamily putative [Albugo laibachii Nc14]CCA24781.1 ATPbinding Cassette (ABC) Superfamily putative [Albugo laibachii Nc14]|eukprot:CCA24781.1 ATPbinding Cassette (ABC) Superfamily putative [Albugo laibachii Nc14]